MSYRGRGRGRGRGGPVYYRRVQQLAFELFPGIESLGVAKYPEEEARKYYKGISLSQNLKEFCETSPYYYEDRSRRLEKVQNTDIERYSDRKVQATKAKTPLWHLIKMDRDHMPEELAEGGEKRVVKKVQWDNEIDLRKLDVFEKLEEKFQGKEEEGEEEEEEVNEEDDGELSDEGDYEQGEYFDDDEDDFNMDDDNDEGEY